jgi:hypothetical protein
MVVVEVHAQGSKLDPVLEPHTWPDSHPILGMGEVEGSRMSGTPGLVIGLPGDHCYHLDTDVDPTGMGKCGP